MKSIKKALIIIVLAAVSTGCSLLNIGTAEWSISGAISEEFAESDVQLAAFFTNGSGSDMEPVLDMETCRLVSNIDAAADRKFSLDITAPDKDVTHDVYSNFIDVVFWRDTNNNEELDSGDQYSFAISAEEDSIFPYWISFCKTGEKYAGVPYRWEAYSTTTYPVAFLEMTDITVEPCENWEEVE